MTPAYSASGTSTAQKAEMASAAETLLSLALARMWPLDASIGSLVSALDLAQAAGDRALEGRIKFAYDYHFAAGMLVTAETAENKGEKAAAPHLMARGCAFFGRATSTDEPLLVEGLGRIKEFCSSVSPRETLPNEAADQIRKIAGIYIGEIAALEGRGDFASALSYALAIKDLAKMVGEQELAAHAERLLSVYRALNLAWLTGFYMEQENPVRANAVKGLTCTMANLVSPEDTARLSRTKEATCGLSV